MEEVAYTIKAYYSEIAEHDKQVISAEFCKPNIPNLLESSQIHIILATDAMGMGIDNPDIRMVVQ